MAKKKKAKKIEWTIFEGSTGNVHSARFEETGSAIDELTGEDSTVGNCFVRFGYGETDDGVTHTGVYAGVPATLWANWAGCAPENVPHGGFWILIRQYPYEKLT